MMTGEANVAHKSIKYELCSFKVEKLWITNLWNHVERWMRKTKVYAFSTWYCQKIKFLVSQVKIKFASSPRLFPSLTAHTQNKWKLYIWFCSGTISIPIYMQSKNHIWHQKKQFAYVAAFKKNFIHPNCKTEPCFRKLNSLPTKLDMLFPLNSKASDFCPWTFCLLLPLECWTGMLDWIIGFNLLISHDLHPIRCSEFGYINFLMLL